MNDLKLKGKMSRCVVVSLALMGFGALGLASGCVANESDVPKENEEQVAAAVGELNAQTQKDLGLEDVVGDLRLDEHVLHVAENHVQPVLQTLGAKYIGNGQYTMAGVADPFTLNVLLYEYVPPPTYVCSCSGYKVYKNARCADVAASSTCYNNSTAGTSTLYQTNAHKKCRFGTGYCASYQYHYVGTVQTFNLLNCVGPNSAPMSRYGEACY